MPKNTPLLLALGFLFSGVAFAESNNLDERAKDPTYKPRGEVRCSGGGCKTIVANDKHMGVIVEGKDKKSTKKKAAKKADELNEEAKADEVDGDVFDTCLQFPELC
ncbi:MAG: hypothetical protein VX899_16735 [Myxococcota bacterium]|nr:hypothetical protein [Myxococcota bacterium]